MVDFQPERHQVHGIRYIGYITLVAMASRCARGWKTTRNAGWSNNILPFNQPTIACLACFWLSRLTFFVSWNGPSFFKQAGKVHQISVFKEAQSHSAQISDEFWCRLEPSWLQNGSNAVPSTLRSNFQLGHWDCWDPPHWHRASGARGAIARAAHSEASAWQTLQSGFWMLLTYNCGLYGLCPGGNILQYD